MATIRPFAALRPTKERAQDVAALPYDVMNSEEAREMVKDNPYSFLHVDKAEIDLPKEIDLYDDKVYQKAKENLDKLVKDKVLVRDSQPNYYIYQLMMDGRKQTGLVMGSSIDEYMDGTIKRHEFTRQDKEEDRIRHVDTCNAQTGPIFLAYSDHDQVDQLIEDWKETNQPVYDFTAEDGISHTAWVVDDKKTQQALTALFEEIPALYIADGHHRTASAANVALQRRKENGGDKDGPAFYFLSVAFPASQLHIFDYNRLVKDLAGCTKEEFLDKIVNNGFTITSQGGEPYRPKEPNEFGMYLDGTWYLLDGKELAKERSGPVDSLDVSLLQEELLAPILGIGDPRVDTRIDFVGGIRGLKELERRVDKGDWAVAFSMYPTTIQQVMDIADADEVMPPKSTWFEPKLRSGLFINPLD